MAKLPKRLFKDRDPGPQEPKPLKWPPMEHGEHVAFSDGVDGVVLMLEPGMCVIQREDGLSYCARKDPEGLWSGFGERWEPYRALYSTVEMLYRFNREHRGHDAMTARSKVKEELRKALDGQEYATGHKNIDGRLEVTLSSAGMIRFSVARGGLDYRDPYQQETVFSVADKVLDELTKS
jgi:hypothetical protein